MDRSIENDIDYISIQYTKDTGRRVLRRSDGPNLSKSLSADPISEPPLRSPSSTTRHPLPHYQRRQINNDDLIESINLVGLKLADCLSITESVLDTLVQHRPPSDPNLSEAAQKTLGVAALPFGLTNVATSFQDALRGKFTDQVGGIHPLTDQIAD